MSAVETFERVAQSIHTDLGSGSHPSDCVSVADTSVSTIREIPAQAPLVTSLTAPIGSQPTKVAEEKERRLILAKTNAETRRTGRKLVRPRLVQHEEPQLDVEMSEADGTNNEGKHAISHDFESQGNAVLPGKSPLRKRLAPPASELSQESLNLGEIASEVAPPVLKKSKGSELSQESLIQGEIASEVAPPVLKKSKGSDFQPGVAEGPSAVLGESMVTQPAVDETLDATGDLSQGSNDDAVDAEKEEFEEPKESQDVDGMNEVDLQENKNDILEEGLDKPTEIEVLFDEGSKEQEVECDREEGELVPDVEADLEVGIPSNTTGSPATGEGQSEPVGTPVASPPRGDESNLVAAAAEGDTTEVQNKEKNDGDSAEKVIAERL
ncbi:nuclear-pore anchor-like [Carica papaya]|uniref:nuclear-pore anchor-like n=1 Tax=Carica papaya TaxID=3649 RepID=UPI000B8CF2CD|nr:nuclear-pore anchor-like [Carica papaya]